MIQTTEKRPYALVPDLDLAYLWHRLNLTENKFKNAYGKPSGDLVFQVDGYSIWDKIDEELKLRKVNPDTFERTVTKEVQESIL